MVHKVTWGTIKWVRFGEVVKIASLKMCNNYVIYYYINRIYNNIIIIQGVRMLEEEETITQTTNPIPTNQPEESFYDEKGKQLKASLIKLAKASHHKTFMEICLREKKKPRETCDYG